MSVVLSLTGFSGSGKSTLANKLVERDKCTLVSFNEVVHGLARHEGMESATQYISEFGINRALRDSRAVITATIKHGEVLSFVLDGLYDPTLAGILKGQFGDKALTINVIASEPIKIARIMRKYGVTEAEALKLCAIRDAPKISAGMLCVMDRKDVEVINDGTISDALSCLDRYTALMRG